MTASSEKERVLGLAEQEAVRYVSFQFTDILGVVKSVTIPIHQFEAAIDHGLWFDGSSVEGFTRIHESDMYLQPDLATFGVIPWEREADVTARVICESIAYRCPAAGAAWCASSRMRSAPLRNSPSQSRRVAV